MTIDRRDRRGLDGPRHRLSAGGGGTSRWASTTRRRNGARRCRSGLKRARDLLDGDPALLDRISAHDQMAPAMADAAFVFEAAPEKLPLKQQIFAELESLSPRRHHPRQQQLGHSLDRDRRQAQAPRARGRHAFLEPAASRAAGRGDPERGDQRRNRAPHDGASARRRAARRCTSRRTSRASSATGCNTRSSARRSRWSPPASATPRPSTRW